MEEEKSQKQIYQTFYDENYKREYYYNPETKETTWKLPENAEALPIGLNLQKASKGKNWEDGRKYLDRPAKKQLEKYIGKEFQYIEGDEEYNIWYDKYLNDRPVRERTPAATRCDPEKDSGYTKASLYNRDCSYICLHFIRGCCAEGANCRFLHFLPSLSMVQKVEQIKDIFGRTRHSSFREDMGGIGCFGKDTRTLYVADITLPPDDNAVQVVNEML